MKRIVIAFTLACSLLLLPGTTRAADESTAPAAANNTRTEKKPKQMPFRGKLVAVDAAAGTITLQGKEKNRSLLVSTTTKISRDGKPVTLETVKAGESVGGLAKATPSGEWEVVTLNVGIKPGKGAGDGARSEEAME
jgi:hypothetical protein